MTMHWPQTRQANSIAVGQERVLPEGSDLVQSMALMGVRISFPRNAEIFGDAEPAEFVYLNISGTVRTSKILVDGRRQIGGFYLPGDVFGLDMGMSTPFQPRRLAM
jgi:CRP/FNR family transcriptional regulator, nitrogen fixation regulation protein